MPIGLSSENDDSRLDLSGQAGRQAAKPSGSNTQYFVNLLIQ